MKSTEETRRNEVINNKLTVFYIKDKIYRDVFIKGVLDWDYFETNKQIQYVNSNDERQLNVPSNPYEDRTKFEAYNRLVKHFKADDKFIELLTEIVCFETIYKETYDIEAELLEW